MYGWPEGPRAIGGSRGVIEFLWGAKGLKLTPARVNMLPKNLPAGEIPPLTSDASNAVLRVMFPMEPTAPRAWHDVAVPISEQWEACNGTGNAMFHNGKFWMFYPTPDYDGHRGGIQLATSDDGEHFTKHPRHPFLPGGDCEVFADPDQQKKTVHLLKAGKTSGSGLPELGDKTLVAWVSPADLNQQGAGVLTVEGAGSQAGQFDSLVLGEAAPRRWMAGSDNFRRTQRDQRRNAEETAKPGEWLQLAAVYAGNMVTLYRNGSRYARYEIESPLHFAAGGRVLVGLRHLDRRDDPKAHFRGAIADARVYNTALTDGQIAELRAHESAGPKPLVWFDFKPGGTADRAGTLPPGELEGNAAVRDGALTLDGERSCLVTGGRKIALAHWVSEDCETWQELPEPFLVTDEAVVPQMCPHWFRWNGWYYFIGGVDGIFRSREPYGPWTRQWPGRLDNLSVPKTGAFTGNRRIFAGFLNDDGWGGNLVMRDLVQHDDGTLSTRFVPEMIPACGEPIALKNAATSILLEPQQGRRQLLFGAIPNDVRITLTLAPHGAKTYGVRLRTTDGKRDGTEFCLTPRTGRAHFSVSTHSGSAGRTHGGPAIAGLRGLDQPVRLDIICRHDLVDVEVDGRHTLINRFWNPRGDRFGVWAEDGPLTVRDVVVRPLLEHVPSGALRSPEPRSAQPN